MAMIMEQWHSDCQIDESWPTLDAARRCASAKGCRGQARIASRRGLAQYTSRHGVKASKNVQCIAKDVAMGNLKFDGQGPIQMESSEDRIAAGKDFSSGEAQAERTTRPKRTVVLSLDYDNCMDVLFEGTYLRLHRRKMTKELEVMERVRNTVQKDLQRITAGADRVILMVGSNRQSINVDQFNRARLEKEIGPICSKVGWVRHDFQKLAEEMGWELNRALLADKENDAPPGTAWDNNELHIKFGQGMDKHIKQNMIQYQFDQLRDIEGHIDFYFFDDNSEYLDFVRQQVAVPSSTQFFTVHFDWYSHIVEQTPMDLRAVDTEDQAQCLDTRRS